MRKVVLFIASSLNGKIARKDGSVDWLDAVPNPENTDYGYAAFYDSVDTIIQGRKTYDQTMKMVDVFPYQGKENFVFTRNPEAEHTPHVKFISKDPVEFVKTLKREPGGDIWLVGGGQINGLLLEAGLIDEAIVFMMPVVIPDGVDIFDGLNKDIHLRFLSQISYSSGVVEIKYAK